MVSFSPNSEGCRPDPVVLPAIVVLIFIVISLVWIAKVGASLEATHNYTSSSAGISSIFEWIKKTGKPTVVRANIAEGFGLPNSDIPVLERGFRAEGEKLTHVCAVGAGSDFENLIFLSTVEEADGSATVWQTNKDGTLVATVVFDGGIVEKLPNSRFNGEFRSELDYFLKKARSASLQKESRATSQGTRIDSQYPAPNRSRYAPLKLETTVLTSSPFILPAIVLVLIASASTGRRQG
jgi:hypothetical protein